MTDANTLRELADRQEISGLLYRYCRSVDRLDVPLGRSIWHEDAIADYGEGFYVGDGRGVIDLICEQHLGLLHHSHQIANILIELDGDRAASEAYVTATLRMQVGEKLQQIGVWGRYLDEWSRRDGRWGLAKRTYVCDFDELRDVTPMDEHDRTRRDHTDPSYAVLGRIGRT